MSNLINPDVEEMVNNGLTLPSGRVKIEIDRSMFDGKMAAILSGARGASCHMCTATKNERS